MSRRRTDPRPNFLAAALWLVALAWLFATAAWELPDLPNDQWPPIYAAGGDGP